MSQFEHPMKRVPANDNEDPNELGPKQYSGTLGEPEAGKPFGDIAKDIVEKLNPDKTEEWIDGEPPTEER